MAKFEEKFLVLNIKHLRNMADEIPEKIDEFFDLLNCIKSYIPENKYYVVNQDEPYAQKVLDTILEGESLKET